MTPFHKISTADIQTTHPQEKSPTETISPTSPMQAHPEYTQSSLRRALFNIALLATFFLGANSTLLGQDSPPANLKKATTAGPQLDVAHLELLLRPLTKEELLVEVQRWRDLLRANIKDISEHEIATRDKNKEIAVADATESISEQEEGQKREEKKSNLDLLVELREKKSALLERFAATLEAYESKGGDASEYRLYAQAVSGLKVEITDVNSTWTAVHGWLTSKSGGMKWVSKILQFLAIMVAFWILARIAGGLVKKATSMRRSMSELLRAFVNNMTRRAILLIGLLMALSSAGVHVGALLALIGGGAFIVGFALQDTLGNFAAGVMLLLYRPFDVSDVVEIASVSGKVDKVSLVSTTIRTFDNKIVLVPNKQVWGQVITNSTASSKRRVDMVFGIGYNDDVDQAKELLARIVSEHELILEDPEPVIRLHELADSSINLICRPWVKTDDYWTVYWDVTEQVKKDFDTHQISIPFPQQDVHVHQVEG
ncbi:MAG: small conductance mechanosensitive channel [Verrucomicrobiales bacterium]|jgi:small conductance mechanosensitive channel